MNFGLNIETFITIFSIVLSTIGIVYILRFNWKQYGALFLFSAITGELICIFFIKVGFYSYPYRLFPSISSMPFVIILTMFPLYVLIGVRYSPKSWYHKVPFYLIIVHIGVLLELLFENTTELIKYDRFWDGWDSYTWWWVFLLTFEFIGGTIVSEKFRKPLNIETLRFGRIGWIIQHLIFIATIFLFGFYVGRATL
ncbi:CBO0543 family protein [Sporosalibacterium faouarense]|uniref:CBO0543 family protein n=1 Tax=Sporosalibacterium faouarense TaxID=516123 RepID=UPI00141CACD8|nr:CBO0543 family protein [Sporosalibacterium faouarense]MTI48711.1 hypothetical protein [Bacillota bacterium]